MHRVYLGGDAVIVRKNAFPRAAEGGARSVGPPFRAGIMQVNRQPAKRATEQKHSRRPILSPATRARLIARASFPGLKAEATDLLPPSAALT